MRAFEEAVTKARAKVAHRRARKRTESEREATIERLSIEPAAISEVAYKIIRADLQAARELYRILVAGGSDAACRSTAEGQRLFATLTAGKLDSDPIFVRRDGGVWGKSHQLRPMLDACNRAKIKPPVSFHVLRHTHGSTLAMRGVPTAVIAEQLGHSDTRMTEKHYAHLAPSYVADTIRAHFPRLGIENGGNVLSIMRGGKRDRRSHD
jgi:Phage integrase family